jgi:uncharacterized protein YjbI with pentapeptide repeats
VVNEAGGVWGSAVEVPRLAANLVGTDLSGANLSGADLSGANMSGIIWSNTVCPDGTISNNDGGACLGHL